MPDNIDRCLGSNMSSVRSPMNNNNYLPSPAFTLLPSRLQTSATLNNSMYPSSNNTQFTFGVPTQPPTITSSQQFIPAAPRGIVMQQNSAPGVGVSWQHTVPKKMPWSESTGMQFTSSPITSSPKVSFSSTTTLNKPTSSSTYRPKRHHVSFDDEWAPPIKRFLSEEKMAASMQNLYIGNMPNNSSTITGKDNVSNTTDSWEKFFKLEERLKDEDLIEEEPIVENVKKNTKFKISDAVKDSLFTQEPLLPPKVLENLNKKALEVVLWKPPEGVVNEILVKVKKGDNSSEKSSKNGSTDNMINESIVNGKSVFPYGMNDVTNEMDVDMFDNVDDEMGL